MLPLKCLFCFREESAYETMKSSELGKRTVRKKERPVLYPSLETTLLQRIDKLQRRTGEMMRSQEVKSLALAIWQELLAAGLVTDKDAAFHASIGWIHGFKKRNRIMTKRRELKKPRAPKPKVSFAISITALLSRCSDYVRKRALFRIKQIFVKYYTRESRAAKVL